MSSHYANNVHLSHSVAVHSPLVAEIPLHYSSRVWEKVVFKLVSIVCRFDRSNAAHTTNTTARVGLHPISVHSVPSQYHQSDPRKCDLGLMWLQSSKLFHSKPSHSLTVPTTTEQQRQPHRQPSHAARRVHTVIIRSPSPQLLDVLWRSRSVRWTASCPLRIVWFTVSQMAFEERFLG